VSTPVAPAGGDAKPTKKIALAAPVMPAPTAPAAGAGSDDESRAARKEMDRLRKSIYDASEEDTPAVARSAIPQFAQLLPRLHSAEDSAWLYLYTASAHAMAERPERACEPYRQAKRLGTSSQIKDAIATLLAGGLTCAP
jgi:hypothetical protein